MTETTALDVACEQFLDQINRASSRDTYHWGLVAFRRFLADREIGTQTFEEFYQWLWKQEYTPQTIQTYIAAVRRLLTWMDVHELLPDGFQFTRAMNRLSVARSQRGAAPYKHRRPDPKLPRIVTYYDELPLPEGESWQVRKDRLILLRNRAVVHTLYSSGGRVSELASLTREQVMDGRLDEIHITGKGGYPRIILLTDEAMQAIRAYTKERDDKEKGLFVSHGRCAGQPIGRVTIWKIVKDAVKVLDLHESTSPHSFRHFRATQLLNEGMPLETVQKYLGHRYIDTTRTVYAHTETTVLKDQFNTYRLSPKEALQK